MKRNTGSRPAYPKKKTSSKKVGKISEVRTPDEWLPAGASPAPKKTTRKARAAEETPEKSMELEDLQDPRNEPQDDPRDSEDSEDADILELENGEPEDSAAYPTPLPQKGPGAADITEAELGAVSTSDPLRRYLEEVKRYPLLEPEEEFRLALHLRETGDLGAARTLVSANLRLVVKIAFEYRNLYSNVMDLIQEGNIGLMKAVSKFDPSKGARLGYYASWWIRSYILKYLLDNFRLVKIGTTQAQKKLFYHLMREKERLEAQGLLAGPKLLAEKLQVREKDVVEMQQRLSGNGSEISLETPIAGEGERPLQPIQLLRDERESADETLEREELIRILKNKLPEFKKLLNAKEIQVLENRLLSEEPKTLQEVADLYGLTRERARQIESKVVKKLREFLGITVEIP